MPGSWERAANMQQRWTMSPDYVAEFGVCTLDEEKEMDPDSVGSRGSEQTAPTSFEID